jgi:hypothetical protein
MISALRIFHEDFTRLSVKFIKLVIHIINPQIKIVNQQINLVKCALVTAARVVPDPSEPMNQRVQWWHISHHQ